MGPPSDNFELHSVRTVTNDAPRRQTGLAKEGKLLRYRERSAWIFAFYFPLLILPWMFTAILMFRPINLHSYLNQTGIYRPKDITYLKRFRLAVDILTQIAATLGIPIVSALLAHGAVVYTQRRRSGQHLDLLQFFTLADRQWLNVRHIWKSFTTLPKNWNSSSTYLRLAAGLIFITAVQPPLRSALVRDETIPIMTCYPNACKYNNRDTWIIGSDADPEGLAESPSTWIIQRTSEKIISVDEKDTQLNLWSDTPYWLDRYSTARLDKRNFQWALGLLSDESEHLFFTSSVPNGTSTGIFRYHAVRMDSKAKCTKGSSSSSSCKGTRPFTASLSLPYTNVEVCVDGNQDANPWTLSRDKQEIKERLLLQVSSWHDNAYYGSENFTIECESVSRRGWFELPNYHNGYKPGPLLDVWPSEEELARDFNDDISEGFWLENDEPTPGPLMTAGLAMFGNTSFFHLAANALDIAMYFANEALLTGRSDRPLYYNPGVMVTKPKKSLPALVVITVLVGLQAIGLCLLMAFIYSTPTWTVDLDADALTQIGAQLKDLDEIMSRNQVCGLVGTVEDRGNDETSSRHINIFYLQPASHLPSMPRLKQHCPQM
ncbi:hypothetical protein CEP51_005900 [Fusarium floridanum]|nr:hypothetical protein CEP51_005900 [Fusarium floridanum]